MYECISGHTLSAMLSMTFDPLVLLTSNVLITTTKIIIFSLQAQSKLFFGTCSIDTSKELSSILEFKSQI